MNTNIYTVGALVAGAYLSVPISGIVVGYRRDVGSDVIEITVKLDVLTHILGRLRDEVTAVVTPNGNDPDGTGTHLKVTGFKAPGS